MLCIPVNVNIIMKVTIITLSEKLYVNVVSLIMQIADRRFGRTHLAIYGPKWAQKKSKSER